ncbi:hypothetical protein [Azospirillum halopraeferens]|nr:hypothetical protein [Azospirillum halopraeferens]
MATAFVIDEAYLRLPGRAWPILSLTRVHPEGDDDTRARSVARNA